MYSLHHNIDDTNYAYMYIINLYCVLLHTSVIVSSGCVAMVLAAWLFLAYAKLLSPVPTVHCNGLMRFALGVFLCYVLVPGAAPVRVLQN